MRSLNSLKIGVCPLVRNFELLGFGGAQHRKCNSNAVCNDSVEAIAVALWSNQSCQDGKFDSAPNSTLYFLHLAYLQ